MSRWPLVGYPLLLLGSILTAFEVTDATHGSGQVWLAIGGLFELILPIWLIAKGFTFPRSTLSPPHHLEGGRTG